MLLYKTNYKHTISCKKPIFAVLLSLPQSKQTIQTSCNFDKLNQTKKFIDLRDYLRADKSNDFQTDFN